MCEHEKLLPCRFCESTEVSVRADDADARSWVGVVTCNDCNITVSTELCEDSEDEAVKVIVEQWNRRPN